RDRRSACHRPCGVSGSAPGPVRCGARPAVARRMTATVARAATLSAAERRLGGLLAIAARSLSQGGHDDFNQGQVSVRLPGSDRFLIKNALTGFSDCTPDTVVLASVDPDAPPHRDAPPELVLHQAVYAARPD